MTRETRTKYVKERGLSVEALATMASAENPDGTAYTLPVDRAAKSTWSITVTADNAAATVTRAAEAAKSHYITSVSGGFSAAVAGKLMTLKDGVTVIGNFHVHNQRDVVFSDPIKLTANSAAELSLAASGSAGQIGAVTMSGYTE